MANKYAINDEELNKVIGGRTLPKNWEKIADMMAPEYVKKYKGKINYAEACEMAKQYFPDLEDQALIFEYLKKYFPEEFEN